MIYLSERKFSFSPAYCLGKTFLQHPVNQQQRVCFHHQNWIEGRGRASVQIFHHYQMLPNKDLVNYEYYWTLKRKGKTLYLQQNSNTDNDFDYSNNWQMQNTVNSTWSLVLRKGHLISEDIHKNEHWHPWRLNIYTKLVYKPNMSFLDRLLLSFCQNLYV